jgi:hypothetical protein
MNYDCKMQHLCYKEQLGLEIHCVITWISSFANLSYWRTSVHAVCAREVARLQISLMLPQHSLFYTSCSLFLKHRTQSSYHYTFWPLNSTFNTATRTETLQSFTRLHASSEQTAQPWWNGKKACVTALYWIVPDSWLLSKQDLASPANTATKSCRCPCSLHCMRIDSLILEIRLGTSVQ